MSVSTVITLGYGNFAGVNFIPTLGFGDYGEAVPPPVRPRRTVCVRGRAENITANSRAGAVTARRRPTPINSEG